MKIIQAAAAAALIATTGAASAATISWTSALVPFSSPAPYNGVMDPGAFNTTGTLVLAENSGGSPTSFDGIAFAAGTISFGNTYNGFGDGTSPLSPTATYSSLPTTVTLNGLTAGNTYRVQVLMYDGRGSLPGRKASFDSGPSEQYAYGISGVDWGDGRMWTGAFTADAAAQNFTIETFSPGGVSVGSQMNAITLYQTAAVPEPATGVFAVAACGLLTLRRRRA